MMNFSKRSSFSAAALNPLTVLIESLRAENRSILDLTESNPTRVGLREDAEDPLRVLSASETSCYDPDPRGSLMAREAIRRLYAERGADVPVERIFLTAGTSQAYAVLFQILADPGQEIVSFAPGYPLFDVLADLCDVRLRTVSASYAEGQGWVSDPDALQGALGPRVKAVLLVNPSNPAGTYVRRETFARFGDLSSRSGAALICDEVFYDHPWKDDVPSVSSAALRENLTFTLDGASKLLGLPQMKLGWIVVSGPDADVEEACRRLEHALDAFLSVSGPMQAALPHWLADRSTIEGSIRHRIRSNRRVLESALVGSSLRLHAGEGGWASILGLPQGREDEEFCLDLLRTQGVMTHPGYYFDLPDEALVISLLPREEEFREGVRRILEYISK